MWRRLVHVLVLVPWVAAVARVGALAVWDGPASDMPEALRTSVTRARGVLAKRLPRLGATTGDGMSRWRERFEPWPASRPPAA